MALKPEDHWMAIAALGGIAFGYWYWTHKNSTTNASDSTASTATAESPSASPLIAGMSGQANNVTTPSMVYQNAGVGYTAPDGSIVTSQGQFFPLPTNG